MARWAEIAANVNSAKAILGAIAVVLLVVVFSIFDWMNDNHKGGTS